MKQNVDATVAIQVLPHGEGLELPFYASELAAGADLRAAIEQEVVLESGTYQLIPTGFSMALPVGFEAQIRPRSGLALKHGVTVLNSPGTIDADYRGEVGVVLVNHGAKALHIQRGDRIAQMVIASVVQASFQSVTCLDETERGEGGFGSSGRN